MTRLCFYSVLDEKESLLYLLGTPQVFVQVPNMIHQQSMPRGMQCGEIPSFLIRALRYLQ